MQILTQVTETSVVMPDGHRYHRVRWVHGNGNLGCKWYDDGHPTKRGQKQFRALCDKETMEILERKYDKL